MASTGSRALQLLGLLQRRRWWPGSELADRLDVSVRTLRDDWRTFRLDRMRDPRPARNSYSARAWPDQNLAAFVQRSIRERPGRSRVVIDVDCAGDEVRRRFGRWATVDDVDPQQCRVTMDTDSFDGPIQLVVNLDRDFRVIEPDAFRDRIATVAARLASAVTDVADTGGSRAG